VNVASFGGSDVLRGAVEVMDVDRSLMLLTRSA
jgi:hypothetical protein